MTKKADEKPERLSKEQRQFLMEKYTGRSCAELTELFNAHFKTEKTQAQIRTFVHNRGIILRWLRVRLR